VSSSTEEEADSDEEDVKKFAPKPASKAKTVESSDDSSKENFIKEEWKKENMMERKTDYSSSVLTHACFTNLIPQLGDLTLNKEKLLLNSSNFLLHYFL
jgi:hypothetical protein